MDFASILNGLNNQKKEISADAQLIKKQLIDASSTLEFKNYITEASPQLFNIIYQSIRESYPEEKYPDGLSDDVILQIEQEFTLCNSITPEDIGPEEDREKIKGVVKSIQDKLIQLVKDAKSNLPNVTEEQYRAMNLKKLDAALKTRKQNGVFDQLDSFVQDKFGGISLKDPSSLPKALMKKIGGGDKDDPERMITGSETGLGIADMSGPRKTFLNDRVFGVILGGSMIIGLGYMILPLFPLLLARKAIPSTVPLLGGLKVNSVLAWETALNPIAKDSVRKGVGPLQNNTSLFSNSDYKGRVLVDDIISDVRHLFDNKNEEDLDEGKEGVSRSTSFSSIIKGEDGLLDDLSAARSAKDIEPPKVDDDKNLTLARKMQVVIKDLLNDNTKKTKLITELGDGKYQNQSKFGKMINNISPGNTFNSEEIDKLIIVINNTNGKDTDNVLTQISNMNEGELANFIDAKLALVGNAQQKSPEEKPCHVDALKDKRDKQQKGEQGDERSPVPPVR